MSLSKLHSEQSLPINIEINTGFCSLDDECIDNIFDWLSIEDLCKLKVTCKRLYLLANEHYQRTYRQVFALYDKHERGKDESERNYKYHKSFALLAQKAVFYGERKNFNFKTSICKISDMSSKLNQNMRYIYFKCKNFEYNDSNDMDLRDKLINVKGIGVYSSLSDRFLELFTNLEYIRFSKYGCFGDLMGYYPTLKQLFWCWEMGCDEEKMKIFVRRHPNIKVFSTDTPNYIMEWLLKTEIKFDDLVLKIERVCYDLGVHVAESIKNLHSLHNNRQIKTLHLKIRNIDFLLNPKFSTLTFIESIHFDNAVGDTDKIINAFASLPNLKFLKFHGKFSLEKSQFMFLAQKLNKLEEFHTSIICSIEDMMPFVRYSANLKCINLECSLKRCYYSLDRFKHVYFINNCEFKFEIIPTTLKMLDEERRKLENACKLTIYMQEKNYLHMKNSSSTSSYGLVEIKRIDSYPLSEHPLRPYYDINIVY